MFSHQTRVSKLNQTDNSGVAQYSQYRLEVDRWQQQRRRLLPFNYINTSAFVLLAGNTSLFSSLLWNTLCLPFQYFKCLRDIFQFYHMLKISVSWLSTVISDHNTDRTKTTHCVWCQSPAETATNATRRWIQNHEIVNKETNACERKQSKKRRKKLPDVSR